MTIKDTLTEIVVSIMPSNAKIRVNHQIENYQANISWNLDNDPERPNKKSKTIILNVPDEVLQDILNLPEAQQQGALNKIQSYLRSNLEGFDPDHNEPYEMPSPSVTWVINSTIAGLKS